MSKQTVPADKTILERVEDILDRERDRAEGVMNASRGGDNLHGHRYDCGYWEGLLYALATINALVAAEEQSP